MTNSKKKSVVNTLDVAKLKTVAGGTFGGWGCGGGYRGGCGCRCS